MAVSAGLTLYTFHVRAQRKSYLGKQACLRQDRIKATLQRLTIYVYPYA